MTLPLTRKQMSFNNTLCKLDETQLDGWLVVNMFNMPKFKQLTLRKDNDLKFMYEDKTTGQITVHDPDSRHCPCLACQ